MAESTHDEAARGMRSYTQTSNLGLGKEYVMGTFILGIGIVLFVVYVYGLCKFWTWFLRPLPRLGGR
jgi:hypothetical protein